jgi:hypothetical protein
VLLEQLPEIGLSRREWKVSYIDFLTQLNFLAAPGSMHRTRHSPKSGPDHPTPRFRA